MRLLVSVRSTVEVRPALAGGADILDAKEPSLGSLGAVSSAVLAEIARLVPHTVPLSVALGDLPATEIAGAIAAVERVVPPRDELFVKLGMAGTTEPGDAGRRARAATAAARESGRSTRIVLVAYADYGAAGSPPPDAVARLAGEAGADGILLDTYGKDGRDLFQYLSEADVLAWVERGRAAGMLVAVAGSLSESSLGRVASMPADAVGVRGAACGGARSGEVLEGSVRRLKQALQAGREVRDSQQVITL